MSVVIRKVLPEEVAELKVISEDTSRETFAHDNTEAQLQGYFCLLYTSPSPRD